MAWLTLVLQFFPVVLQLIMAVETAIKALPTTASVVTGAQKKALVTAILTPTPAQADGVSTLIDKTVGALNSTGVFAKDTPVVA